MPYKMQSFCACLLVFVVATKSLKWEKYSAEVAERGLEVSANSQKTKFFCKITVGDAEHVGTIKKNRTLCKAANSATKEIVSSTEFEIMTHVEEEEFKWVYCSQKKPAKAVACDLKLSGEGDCHLGQSVYGDGVCDEDLGYIKNDVVNMVSRGRVSRCPFKMYLVEKSETVDC